MRQLGAGGSGQLGSMISPCMSESGMYSLLVNSSSLTTPQNNSFARKVEEALVWAGAGMGHPPSPEVGGIRHRGKRRSLSR